MQSNTSFQTAKQDDDCRRDCSDVRASSFLASSTRHQLTTRRWLTRRRRRLQKYKSAIVRTKVQEDKRTKKKQEDKRTRGQEYKSTRGQKDERTKVQRTKVQKLFTDTSFSQQIARSSQRWARGQQGARQAGMLCLRATTRDTRIPAKEIKPLCKSAN